MGFLIFLVLVMGAVVAWRLRVPIMAKVLGQSEDRIRRQIERRKR